MKTLKHILATTMILGILAATTLTCHATNWGGWQSLGGYSNSQPIAVAQNGAVKVFTIGSNSRLQYCNAATGQWQTLPDSPICIGRPAVVARNGGVDAFVCSGSSFTNTLHHARMEANGSVTWKNLGTASRLPGAAPVVTGSDSLSVFMVGWDGNLYRSFLDTANNWSTFYNLGGAANTMMLSYPAAGVANAYEVHVVYTRDRRLMHWSSALGWEDLGGTINSNPAISVVNSIIMVAGRGTDERIWTRSYHQESGEPAPSWHTWYQTGVRSNGMADPAIACDGLFLFKLLSCYANPYGGDGAGDEPSPTIPWGMEIAPYTTYLQNAIQFGLPYGISAKSTPAVVNVGTFQTNAYVLDTNGVLWEKQIISP